MVQLISLHRTSCEYHLRMKETPLEEGFTDRRLPPRFIETFPTNENRLVTVIIRLA